MQCFNCSNLAAVGTCKVCNKGLCRNCAQDLGYGLACKGEHEQRAAQIEALTDRSLKVMSATQKNVHIAPLFHLFMGAVFLIYGLSSNNGASNMLSVMGTGFIVFGIIVFIKNKQAYTQKETNNHGRQ